MKKAFVMVGRSILSIIYFFMKLAKQKNRVVLISRQSNHPSLDFVLLSNELNTLGINTVVLCKTIERGVLNLLKYGIHMLKQMYYIATSRVVVLDTYCIVVSMLRHRENVRIIQMWHALGAMKKFGLSILDMPEGKQSDIAIPMRMHKGYTDIFTSSEASRTGFAEAFGYPKERLTIMSLPRVDAILDANRDENVRGDIYRTYPELKNGKENILYVPTHRIDSDMKEPIWALIHLVDRDKYNLIIKLHPLTRMDIKNETGIIKDDSFESVDLLTVSNLVVTDYSAITYEVALKGLPLFFYAYDKERYKEGRTFYLDYEKEMPGPICTDVASLIEAIENYDKKAAACKIKKFADKYVEKQENCTMELVNYIKNILE